MKRNKNITVVKSCLAARIWKMSDVQLPGETNRLAPITFVHTCARTKPCETSSQHVFKGRLKQTKPDAPIIGASESLTHRLVSAVNYSRTVFNSPCSTNLNHTRKHGRTHTHTHAETEEKRGKLNVFTRSQLHKEEPCHYLHLRILFSQTTLGCWLINSWGRGGGGGGG